MKELVDVFQSFRKILCICPCCGEIVRLSDLHLKYSGRAPKTWLDEYELEDLSLQEKERLFEEKAEELRQKSVERGRQKVPLLVEKCLCPEFKKLKYDPYDIKAVMDPVDFVVFDGMNAGEEIRSISFLSRKPGQNLTVVTESLRLTVNKGNYDWKVARITTDGKVDYE